MIAVMGCASQHVRLPCVRFIGVSMIAADLWHATLSCNTTQAHATHNVAGHTMTQFAHHCCACQNLQRARPRQQLEPQPVAACQQRFVQSKPLQLTCLLTAADKTAQLLQVVIDGCVGSCAAL